MPYICINNNNRINKLGTFFFFYGVYTFNTIITAALHLRCTYSITCIPNRIFDFQNIVHSIAYIIPVLYYTG